MLSYIFESRSLFLPEKYTYCYFVRFLPPSKYSRSGGWRLLRSGDVDKLFSLV